MPTAEADLNSCFHFYTRESMNQTIAFGVIEVIVTVPESDAGLRLRTLFTNMLLVLNCDVDE